MKPQKKLPYVKDPSYGFPRVQYPQQNATKVFITVLSRVFNALSHRALDSADATSSF